MQRSKRIIAAIILFAIVMTIRLVPSILFQRDLIPNWHIKYFENPSEVSIKEIREQDGESNAVIVLSEPVPIPYSGETAVLHGFENPYYNTSVEIEQIDDNGLLYSTDLEYKAINNSTGGTFYWEGAGGTYSYLVLLAGYLIPFLLSVIWLISIPKFADNVQKYLCYIALWFTGSYVFNILVYHDTDKLSYSFSFVGVLLFISIRFIPTLWNKFVPNYREKFETERLTRLFAEAEQQRLEKMIVGWTKSELKDLEWALFNISHLPKLIEESKNPIDFKTLLFNDIKKAKNKLADIKEKTDTLTTTE